MISADDGYLGIQCLLIPVGFAAGVLGCALALTALARHIEEVIFHDERRHDAETRAAAHRRAAQQRDRRQEQRDRWPAIAAAKPPRRDGRRPKGGHPTRARPPGVPAVQQEQPSQREQRIRERTRRREAKGAAAAAAAASTRWAHLDYSA